LYTTTQFYSPKCQHRHECLCATAPFKISNASHQHVSTSAGTMLGALAFLLQIRVIKVWCFVPQTVLSYHASVCLPVAIHGSAPKSWSFFVVPSRQPNLLNDNLPKICNAILHEWGKARQYTNTTPSPHTHQSHSLSSPFDDQNLVIECEVKINWCRKFRKSSKLDLRIEGEGTCSSSQCNGRRYLWFALSFALWFAWHTGMHRA